MTREEIDKLWQRALQDSVQDREPFTRYHFARLVAELEREGCVRVVLEAGYKSNGVPAYEYIADAIRARKEGE